MITTRKIEQEVNRIRIEIYEETKDMTLVQRRERLEGIALNAQREFGFKRIVNARDENS